VWVRLECRAFRRSTRHDLRQHLAVIRSFPAASFEKQRGVVECRGRQMFTVTWTCTRSITVASQFWALRHSYLSVSSEKSVGPSRMSGPSEIRGDMACTNIWQLRHSDRAVSFKKQCGTVESLDRQTLVAAWFIREAPLVSRISERSDLHVCPWASRSRWVLIECLCRQRFVAVGLARISGSSDIPIGLW